MGAGRLGSFLGAAALALSTVACSQTDPGITTAVKGKLAADDTVKAYRIDVDTKDRVVTLNGAVDTPAARTRAVQLAKATDGVREVVDQLDGHARGDADDRRRRQDPGRSARSGTRCAMPRPTRPRRRPVTRLTAPATRVERRADVRGEDQVPRRHRHLGSEDRRRLEQRRGDADRRRCRSAAEKNRALKVARETDGVKSVVDRLKVGS